MTQDEDFIWIDQILDGNTQVFGRLVSKYEDFVFTIALRVLHHRNDAEDVAMEVFLKVYQGLGKFNRNAGFSTWLYRIAYNTSISEFRKRNKRQIETADEKWLNQNAAMIIDEESDETETDEQRLLMAMRSLSPDENALLTLYYTNNLSVEQISGIVGISTSNVKIRLFRTRKKLEGMMQMEEQINHTTNP
jgi:RNA polymerase sigma factor (sigma-70 family)